MSHSKICYPNFLQVIHSTPNDGFVCLIRSKENPADPSCLYAFRNIPMEYIEDFSYSHNLPVPSSIEEYSEVIEHILEKDPSNIESLSPIESASFHIQVLWRTAMENLSSYDGVLSRNSFPAEVNFNEFIQSIKNNSATNCPLEHVHYCTKMDSFLFDLTFLEGFSTKSNPCL